MLGIVHDIFVSSGALTDALRIAIKLQDKDRILQLFAQTEESKQPYAHKKIGSAAHVLSAESYESNWHSSWDKLR